MSVALAFLAGVAIFTAWRLTPELPFGRRHLALALAYIAGVIVGRLFK